LARFKKVNVLGLSLAVISAEVTPAFAGTAGPRVPDAAVGYAACQTTSETEFRAAIEEITAEALKKGVSGIDYRAAVNDEWRRLDVGRTIDTEVDKAVADVRDETSWGALLQSLGSEDKARELTVAVAERVYRSDAVKTAIEDLATGVGRGLGSRIEIVTSDAAGPALQCLQAFLGPRYGSTVAGVVTGSAGQQFEIGAGTAGGDVTAGGVLGQTAGGITGAAILVMRRQLANMAGRIGQRIVGSVLSRLVSVVAGGIGVVLIAKDVWDLRYGVLPIIATEMKSADSKDKVQDELAKTISEQINEHLGEISRQSSDRIVAIWRDYRAAHAMVLDLAERQADFRGFLDRVRAEALPRVDEVTALLLASEGEAGVLRRLADGTLDEAVNRLPEAAMEIARQTRSVDQALAWNSVAGPNIDKVTEYEIFRRAKPQDFTKKSLERIVALGDPLAVKRLATVAPETRDVLFDLDPAVLTAAARGLSENELATLSGYMTGLAREPRQRLLDRVAKAPEGLGAVTKPRVRDAILASADQGAALDMLLRSPQDDTPEALQNDLQLALQGQIHPELLWHKHPILSVLAIFGLLVFLLLVRRLFRRGPSNQPPAAGTAA
jgi:hypothetical protein